jgi:hypothetical protein
LPETQVDMQCVLAVPIADDQNLFVDPLKVNPSWIRRLPAKSAPITGPDTPGGMGGPYFARAPPIGKQIVPVPHTNSLLSRVAAVEFGDFLLLGNL